jgi:hypothetical protein
LQLNTKKCNLIDRETVRKKTNGLPANRRKEKDKIVSSEKSVYGDTDVYIPTLWYSKELKFPDDNEVATESLSSLIEVIINNMF